MNTAAAVCEIICTELKVPPTEVTPERHFRELPNVDSMRILQIILATEKAFEIEIDDDVTFHIQTVGEYQNLVEKLCGARLG